MRKTLAQASQINLIADEIKSDYWRHHKNLNEKTYNTSSTQRRDMIGLGKLAEAEDLLRNAASILHSIVFTNDFSDDAEGS